MYTADSWLMDVNPVATAGQIADWFEAHNAAAPAGEIGAAVWSWCHAYGLNSDLVAAQVAHETGFWTSGWAAKNNPAGLGVTGEPGAGLSFRSVDAGVGAMVAHLLTYVRGAGNPLREVDPRYAAAAAAGYLGAASRLRDLDGRWAVPGVGYGAAVARLANELVAFASTDEGAAVSGEEWPASDELGVPFTVERADADIGPARDVGSVRWFVVHTTEGHRAGDLQILEHADAAQASVHFWISLTGQVVGIVPIGFTSWTVANQAVDKQAINVELEGFARDGATEPQYQSLAAVFRWCRDQGMTVPAEYVGRDERPGIIGHQDVADPYKPGMWGGASNHTDPGPLFRWAHLVELIAGSEGGEARSESDGSLVSSSSSLTPRSGSSSLTPRVDPVTGYQLAGGFRAYYEWLEEQLGADDALLDVGRPISNEGVENGLTVQYFERTVFERHPGARPERWDVLRRRLGAEALAGKPCPAGRD